MEYHLDEIDLKILTIMQSDGSRSLARMSRAVSRSKATCFKRIQRMREIGIIRHKVTLLDPDALNVRFSAMIILKGRTEKTMAVDLVAAELAGIPEVMDIFHMIENGDLLLRVAISDESGLNCLKTKLRAKVPEFAMNVVPVSCLHRKTALPLTFVPLAETVAL